MIDEKKEAESEIRVITVRPAVSGNSLLCGNVLERGRQKKDTERETGSKRNQLNTTEIQKHFHLIKALQNKSRGEREQMRSASCGQ